MASKSKRRGRVFRASCILAALIIAGSSFAWFTSKDEVTNRLTANSDYGVSIVESFVPPANWLPGQEINKDVYAVNTGTIDAFVKETVSGKLTYTYEVKTEDFTTDCVKLTPQEASTIDGAITEEAGGFLAWTNATVTTTTPTYKVGDTDLEKATVDVTAYATDSSTATSKTFKVSYTDGTTTYYAENDTATELYTLATGTAVDNVYDAHGTALTIGNESTTSPAITPGAVNSARPQDVADENNEPGVDTPRWTPPTTGVYIFRRSIKDESNSTTPSFKYKYAGYYAVVDGDKVDYYKIVIGKDAFRAASESDSTVPNSIVFDVYVDEADLTADSDHAVTVGKDGVLEGNPKICYVKEEKIVNEPVSMEYTDGAAGENDYLKIVYSTKTGDITAAKAAMDAAERDYERAKDALELARAPIADKELQVANALGALNTAKSRYEQTLADYTYAKALAEASNELYAAARAREAINYEQGNRMEAVKTAATNLKTLAGTLLDTTDAGAYHRITDTWANDTDSVNTDDIDAKKLISENIRTYINNNGRANGDSDLDHCKANLQAVDEKWADIVNYSGIIKDRLDKLSKIKNGDDFSEYATPAQVDQWLAELSQACADLEQALDDYGTLYRNFQETFDELHLTGMDLPATAGVVAAITTAKSLATGLKNTVNDATNDTGLTKKVEVYDDAYNAYNDYTNGDVAAADTNWKNAVKTYNNKVGAARSAYDSAIKTAQDLPNQWKENTDAPKLDANNYLTDNSANATIAGLAANNNGANPKISEDSAYTTYAVATRTKDATTHEITTTYAPIDEVVPESNNDNSIGFEQVVTDIPSNAASVLGSAPTKLYVDQLETLKNDAQTTYDTLKGQLDGMSLETEEAAVVSALADYEATERAYNTANTGSNLILKVYLDENVDRNPADSTWTLNTDTDKTTAVEFYLNKVLPGGATSDKLIDYVEMDSSVSASDYKYMTFDLNVGLDSAQITYAADQRTYTATAVNDNPAFALDATVANNEDVTWAKPAAQTTTYTLGYNVINATDIKNEPKTIGTTTYDYKVTIGTTTYYGDGDGDGAKFYKYNPAVADPATPESFDTTPITLTVTTE